ncbi:hypothetical protein SEPCBS119000_003622 [Sporothrix epigloea]|uniref:Uncharacterized protein n=1 Tax=Sporothrix epigloea TaxID=1892477 RepID=A0ABP0DRB0_9PEZI
MALHFAINWKVCYVDRAIDNLVKSGKMFGMPGRREWNPLPTGPTRKHSGFDGRPGQVNPRPHSMAEFGDARGAHQSNLQNFYASQRNQPSRGSNEAEQVIQAKRRMAAQRERELRNYHQEQQYNRTVLAELSSFGNKPDRTLSPGGMSETDRRDLIARQRSALYGEGSFAETGGYVDETGTSRPGVPGPHHGPVASQRVTSPLAYEYSHAPPPGVGADVAAAKDGAVSGSSPTDGNPRSRANSTASPQPKIGGSDRLQQHQSSQANRTSTSSPGTSPVTGNAGNNVAPIGTRPTGSASTSAANSMLNKRSTTPIASPKNHSGGFSAPASNGDNVTGSGSTSNPASATPDSSMGVPGWGNSRAGNVWGNGGKSGMGVQASVWG